MDRESALQVLVEGVLSDQDSGSDRDLVSHFVKGMFNLDWDALKEKLNDPLTEAQVTHVTKRTLGVMCDLVLSLLSHLQPQAQRKSVHMTKSVQFANIMKYDIEFLETSTEEVMFIVTSIQTSLQQKSDAGKVLQALTTNVSNFTKPTQTDQAPSSVTESESNFSHHANDDCCTYFDWKFWLFAHKIKASLKRDKKGHILTVCPQKVTDELSNEEFQRRCQDELTGFLHRKQTMLPNDSEAQVSSERVTAAASELLDAVMSSAYQLCELDTAQKIEVSEDDLYETALDLKCNINSILLRFFSKTELLPEDGSTDELIRSLEDADILSQSKLTLFVTLLTDKVYREYFQWDKSEQTEQSPSFKSGSLPEVNKTGALTQIVPSKKACAFVAEAMTFLIKSLRFPSTNSESANSMSKSTLLPDDATNKQESDPELESDALEQLIARLQHLQPELF